MEKEGWYSVHKQILPKPVLGSMPQSIELHLFDKSGLSDGKGPGKWEARKYEEKDKKDEEDSEKSSED
jgi:hypothetical protein